MTRGKGSGNFYVDQHFNVEFEAAVNYPGLKAGAWSRKTTS